MNNDFDFSDGLFVCFWWLIALAAAGWLIKTRRLQDFAARFAVNVRAKCDLDAENYHAFPHLDICCRGKHEQIDCVYVSRFGIFVVSTPNQQGRIWGEAGDAVWTQQFHKSESKFVNPLLKNQRYIQALSEQLSLPQKVFYSAVVFPKNCQFQTMMPDNVLDTADFDEFIGQYDEVVLTEEEVAAVRAQLETSEFDVVFGRGLRPTWPLNSHS